MADQDVGLPHNEHTFRRDLAYWREVLRHAPSLTRMPNRLRPPAPAGMGRNRGQMGFLCARLSGAEGLGATTLMTAYVDALAEVFSIDAVIIDRWFSERSNAERVDAIGPMDSFFPVILPDLKIEHVNRSSQIDIIEAQAILHRSFDTPALEREFGPWLRDRKIELRQFGFAFIDGKHSSLLSFLDSPLSAIPETPNEIQLAMAIGADGLRVRLGVDLDVCTKEQTQHLFFSLTNKLRTMAKSRSVHICDMDWISKTWPELSSTEIEDDALDPLSLLGNVEREIPVTTPQLTLMREADKPDFDGFSLTNRMIAKEFIVRPQLDLPRLERAVEFLTWRHEAMRTRFFRKGDGFGAYLEQKPSRILFIENVETEEEAIRRGTDLARDVIGMMDPLFRVVLIRFGNDGDLVIAAAHHGITDGYSVGLILEEMMKVYLGMELPKVEMDIETFVREFDFSGSPEIREQRDSFLHQLFENPPPIPDIGRRPTSVWAHDNVLMYGKSDTITHVFSVEERSALLERAKLAGTTESAMVAAAYAGMLTSKGNVDEVILVVVFSGRTSRRLENYVNCVTTNLPVRVRPAAYERIEDLAVAISEAINIASVHPTFVDAFSFSDFRNEVRDKGSYLSLFAAGEVAPGKWSQGALSAPMQRFDASGEIDMGSIKLDLSPGISRDYTITKALDVRTFKTQDSIGIVLNYDTLGFDRDEAEAFLSDVVRRLDM